MNSTEAVIFAFLLVVANVYANPVYNERFGKLLKPKATCGYESCTPVEAGKLNIHMVPHSHDDVGWLKTVDQYYYGARTNIQRAGVQYIIDSVVSALLDNPERKFIIVETAFLWKWWLEQNEAKRDSLRSLVESGQLEIAGGAWSMNDEAATHYHSIIDQFTWGFRVLNDSIGECARPRVGWQIDPFGHSRQMASILAHLGLDGVFFSRLDYQDKAQRQRDKTLEILWQGSSNEGTSAELFTHALYNHYSPPPGFCFDILCGDEPMIDNEASPDYNIPKRVQDFLDFAHRQANYYKTNNIILTMGDDFHYQDAHVWFKNMDKLVKYVNAEQENGSNVTLFYSTPSCYLKAVNEQNEVWTTKQDDFFPYGSDSNTYWNGYFTSKPTTKYFERLGNNFLQVSKQVAVLAGASAEDDAGLTYLREAMGVLQHHDAITGTMKDHVAQDYSRILHEAFVQSGNTAQAAINKLIGNSSPTPVLFESCLKLNISECAITENSDSFVITVYNPLSRPVSQYVRVPVLGTAYLVQQPDGSEVPSQLVPIIDSVLNMPGRESTATTDLVFQAESLPALGFRSYYISKSALKNKNQETRESRASTIGNDAIIVTIDDFGLTSSININGVDISLEQTFEYYIGAWKDNERSSGAYCFRPNGTQTVNLGITNYVVYTGDLVEEVHQTFGDGWISQIIRVYKNENHVEFEWMVGPIPDLNEVGKEVISHFKTDLATNELFYTDSNGRELLQRRRNFRPDWTIDITETIASNYYPIVSKLLIRDEDKGQEFAVLVDRAQSGSSIRDGELELMVHRRLFHDDGFGVGEALNEQAYGQGLVARGKHYVIAGPLTQASPTLATQERNLGQKKMLDAWTFISPTSGLSFQEWSDAYTTEFSGLTNAGLPTNVQILTLEPWKEGSVLLRLEHILELNEDPLLSTTVTLNLEDAFTQWTINSASETTLGGNQWIEDLNRLQWNSGKQSDTNEQQTRAVDITAITLDPIQIRTFILDISVNK